MVAVILDKDMPTRCKECKLFDGEDLCHAHGRFAIDPSVSSVRRPKWCPISECSTPTDDYMIELAKQDRPIMREELGIKTPRTYDGLIKLRFV